MTSTADTAQHPDIEEISDLTEGLLSPSRTADVRRHIDRCPQCDEIHSSLEEIRSLLGDLPADQQMPEDVVARIDAALASESLAQPDASSGATAPVSRETYEQPPEPTVVDRPSGRPRGATGPGRMSRPASSPHGDSRNCLRSGGRRYGRLPAAVGPTGSELRRQGIQRRRGQPAGLLGGHARRPGPPASRRSRGVEDRGSRRDKAVRRHQVIPAEHDPRLGDAQEPPAHACRRRPPAYSRAPAVIPRLWRWSTAATRARRHSSSSCPTRPTRAAYRPMWSTQRASAPLPRQRDSCCSPTPTRAPEHRAGSCSGLAGMHAP